MPNTIASPEGEVAQNAYRKAYQAVYTMRFLYQDLQKQIADLIRPQSEDSENNNYSSRIDEYTQLIEKLLEEAAHLSGDNFLEHNTYRQIERKELDNTSILDYVKYGSATLENPPLFHRETLDSSLLVIQDTYLKKKNISKIQAINQGDKFVEYLSNDQYFDRYYPNSPAPRRVVRRNVEIIPEERQEERIEVETNPLHQDPIFATNQGERKLSRSELRRQNRPGYKPPNARVRQGNERSDAIDDGWEASTDSSDEGSQVASKVEKNRKLRKSSKKANVSRRLSGSRRQNQQGYQPPNVQVYQKDDSSTAKDDDSWENGIDSSDEGSHVASEVQKDRKLVAPGNANNITQAIPLVQPATTVVLSHLFAQSSPPAVNNSNNNLNQQDGGDNLQPKLPENYLAEDITELDADLANADPNYVLLRQLLAARDNPKLTHNKKALVIGVAVGLFLGLAAAAVSGAFLVPLCAAMGAVAPGIVVGVVIAGAIGLFTWAVSAAAITLVARRVLKDDAKQFVAKYHNERVNERTPLTQHSLFAVRRSGTPTSSNEFNAPGVTDIGDEDSNASNYYG